MATILTIVGGNIRRIRKHARLTQEQLAEKADSNPKYLGAVERGEENIGLKKLAQVAAVLRGRSVRTAAAGRRRRAYRRIDRVDQNHGWPHAGVDSRYRAAHSGMERSLREFSEEAPASSRLGPRG